MPNALDVYRAQQNAARDLHAKLTEVAELVQRIRSEVNALTHDRDLRDVLRQEHTWLEQAERTVKEVQRWRDLEAYRFWPGVVYRWAFALAFALFAVWASGAGYAWVTQPYAAELASLRSRIGFADSVEQRILTMTPAERRRFDALMRSDTSSQQ